MSSLMVGSHGVALATATAMAVSGTVILVALCRQQRASQFGLRSCIVLGERKTKTKKKKKRVRFGEFVVVEFDIDDDQTAEEEIVMRAPRIGVNQAKARDMPANRAALYGGMLQDRLQRMACY